MLFKPGALMDKLAEIGSDVVIGVFYTILYYITKSLCESPNFNCIFCVSILICLLTFPCFTTCYVFLLG